MHGELTRKIIGASMKVFNTLGSGFLESVYEKALAVELTNLGIAFETQRPISVLYEGQSVGLFYADVFVEGKVIVELKATETLSKIHEVQLVNYLQATGVDVGLLINFGPRTLEYKRKVRILDQVNPTESR